MRFPIVHRRRRRLWWVPAVLPVALTACSSGGSGAQSGSGASSDAKLKAAGTTVQQQMAAYRSAIQQCKTAASPVVCVEAADRKLGGQVHTYANLLAVGKGFSAPAGVLTAARNSAQTLANSLEILGDAQPTQANYDQVLNTFDVNGALTQLGRAVDKVNAASGG